MQQKQRTKTNLNTLLLPIAIMAHNEEKSIKHSVTSALSQIPPPGFSTKVIIVANACNDKTEKIVKHLQEKNPEKIVLLSTNKKGKTTAIKKLITFLQTEIVSRVINIPYVLLFDADCRFLNRKVLADFIEGFQRKPLLCAISAHCVPDVCFNTRCDLISKIYRATENLNRIAKINSISGMCYCIKFDILCKMDFPDFQFAEDMFVSSRLNGWFYKDIKINVIFETPCGLRNELSRRVRQEISSQRYYYYYSYLKNKGINVEFFRQPLALDYRWGSISKRGLFRSWRRLPKTSNKLYVILYMIIKCVARIVAFKRTKHNRLNENYDYWTVKR